MNIEALVSEIGGLPFSVEPTHIRQKSRDFYWYSPVLKRQLDHVAADVIVTPKSEAEIVAIAAACYRHDAPLTVRGGGTGNYGQAMPLQGGVVLDMTSMDKLVWANKGACRVEAGKKLIDIDAELKPFGAELRMHPSTRAIATIGGFIGGGSGGVGSITWGMLHERGNIIAARLVTLEAEPRVLELRGDDVGKFNHSYGVTGVMTELEMGLAPVEDWIDGVVVFDDFMAGCRFGLAFANSPGLVKKQCAVMAPPIVPAYLRQISAHVGPQQTAVLVMAARQSWEGLEALAAEHGGRISYSKSLEAVEHERALPLYELCWNHTTLWAIRRDPSITYLQTAFPNLEVMEQMHKHFGDEVLMHLEFIRSGGAASCAAIQLVRYTDEARLNEIMRIHEAAGCIQFNPHAYTVEDGGMKVVNQTQLAFKRQIDPKGLLNPGKMRGWTPN